MNIHFPSLSSVFGQPLSALPEADYAALTPYLLPPGVGKKVNIGDGFILDSAIKLIGARPHTMVSSRAPLNDADIERINSSRFMLAVGANTLKDDFELAPGFTMATMARIKVPVILMGVGHYGFANVTRGPKPETIELFRAMLERFPFMSVRCMASRQYVATALPDKADNILMTSCPVVYSVDDINRGFTLKETYEQLVVTVTDRANLAGQLPLLPAAKELFPAKRRVLALHQDYLNAGLWSYAADQGYEVFRAGSYEPFITLYSDTDIHIGNRVHAHLKCLSLGVPSFCTPFDLRQTYFAQSLDYPLISKLPSPELEGYNFSRVVARRAFARQTMDRFLTTLRVLFY